LNLAANTWYY